MKDHKNITKIIVSGNYFVIISARMVFELDFVVRCDALSSPPHLPFRRALGSVTQRLHKCTYRQGQISAHGILHLWKPNLGPNSANQLLDTRIVDPSSSLEFFDPVFFSSRRGPKKFTLKKFTSPKSPSKTQPRNRTQKFPFHSLPQSPSEHRKPYK